MKQMLSYKKQQRILKQQKENERRDREVTSRNYYIGDFKAFAR